MKKAILLLITGVIFLSCSNEEKFEKKGFQVNEISEDEEGHKIVGLKIDSLVLETRPRRVLLTKDSTHRLTPIFKVNYNKKGVPFSGSNDYHTRYYYKKNNTDTANSWNGHIIPGLASTYGYNFVNVSHYNNKTNTQNELFDQPVLIKTLYYPPVFYNDTLNHNPVTRDYYMVSVYDEDTNNDGFISAKDLRRFYLFDLEGHLKKPLIPKNYSVMSSEYDSENDYLYVFAKIDLNNNGQMELKENTHVFWIDLSNPLNSGIQYKNQ